ncbi:MAG TPA: hypothetical protein VIW29_09860 [Polyangiaceae bacterium]
MSLRHCVVWLLVMLALALAPRANAETGQPKGPRLLHAPAASKTTEQGVLTPVPISVEIPDDLQARRVLLHYHVFGAREWRTLELRRENMRYVGAIPCLEVSEMTSEIRYYIRVHDAEGAVIAFSGTRSSPYRVAIHHPSARPDLASEARCPDPVECPPGLPGCPSEEVERIPCVRDSDCEGGLECGWDGYCGVESRRKNWFGVELAQSFGAMAVDGACRVSSQESQGYACFRSRDGAIYTGRPVHTNQAPVVGLAASRVLFSYERVLFYKTSLGVRVGYAFAGEGPTLPGAAGFVPFSAELVARYWFGQDPFAEQGLRPYLMLGAGFAEHDIQGEVDVREDPDAPYSQGGNDLEQTLRVSKRAGDAFVSVGVGAVYPLTRGFGVAFELSLAQAFPYAATVATASGGLRLGLR